MIDYQLQLQGLQVPNNLVILEHETKPHENFVILSTTVSQITVFTITQGKPQLFPLSMKKQ